MENYKNINKILIVLFVLIFVLGNLGIVVFNIIYVDPTEVINERYTISEYLKDSSAPTVRNVTSEVSSLSNFTQITSLIKIYALANSKYIINNSEIELLSGTILVYGDGLTLRSGLNSLKITGKSTLLLDKTDGVISVNGQPTLNGKYLEPNVQVSYNNSENINQFDRQKLKNTRYSQLSIFLEQVNNSTDFFKDFDGPVITSISPRAGFTTVEKSVRFYGYTEAETILKLDDLNLFADEKGYFTTQLDLMVGENEFDLVLKDSFGNLTRQTIKYIRKELNTNPASYAQ